MPFDGRALSPAKQQLLEALGALERARDIVRERWCQAWAIRDKACGWRHCAGAALVIGIEAPETVRSSNLSIRFSHLDDEEHPALTALQFAAGAKDIPRWNDALSDRAAGHDRVVDAFDRAIIDIEKQIAVAE